jgi:hypothetical protein
MAKAPRKLSDKEYQNLGKALERIVQKDYINLALHKGQLMWVGFLRGLATGFGAFLGATLVVALLLWILSLFDSVPFVQNIIDSLDKNKPTIQ